MQAAETYLALVVYSVVQIALGFLDERVDLFQSFQIPYGRGEKETEDHVYIVCESLVALLLIAYEVYHHVGFVVAHGDGYIALMDDAQWHGGIRRTASDFLYVRDT